MKVGFSLVSKLLSGSGIALLLILGSAFLSPKSALAQRPVPTPLVGDFQVCMYFQPAPGVQTSNQCWETSAVSAHANGLDFEDKFTGKQVSVTGTWILIDRQPSADSGKGNYFVHQFDGAHMVWTTHNVPDQIPTGGICFVDASTKYLTCVSGSVLVTEQ